MKSFIKLIIILPISIIIFSCNTSNKIKWDNFPLEYNLKGDSIRTEIPLIHGILNIYDSLLIVTSTPNNVKCIHYFNKNTFKYISSTGIVGNGPNEIIVPGNCSIDSNNGTIWYPDFGKKCIWKFNIKESLSNKDYLPKYQIPLPENLVFFYFKHENDSLFSFGDLASDKLISFFNSTGKLIDSLTVKNTINLYKSEIPDQTRMSTCIYQFDKDIISNEYVVAYRFANVIAKIDASKEASVILQSNDKVNLPDKRDYSQIMTNECIKVYNSNVYCLYSGQPRYFNDGQESNYNYPKTINIFNKKLQPLVKLSLDHTAMWFEIDQENNRIVTFSPETGSFVIYKIPFNLKNKI